MALLLLFPVPGDGASVTAIFGLNGYRLLYDTVDNLATGGARRN